MQIQSLADHHPIYDEINVIISRCKEKADSLKLNLSDIIGVHKTTIWRWEQKLIKKRPQIEGLVQLLKFDSDLSCPSKIINHYKDLKSTTQYIKDKYQSLGNDENVDQTNMIENSPILDNFVSYLAIKLISTSENGEKLEDIIDTLIEAQYLESKNVLVGIKKETAVKSIRPIVVELIEGLIKENFLIKNSDGKLSIAGRRVQWPFEMTQKFLPKMFMFVNPEKWIDTDFFTRGQTFSASDEDIYQATRAFFKGYKEAINILEKSQGNKKVQLMAMFESLDLKNETNSMSNDMKKGEVLQ